MIRAFFQNNRRLSLPLPPRNDRHHHHQAVLEAMLAAPAAAPVVIVNEAHQRAKIDPQLMTLRVLGVQTVEAAARAQRRGQLPMAVWNLETETLMTANEMFLELFDIPVLEVEQGTMTIIRLLNTDALFVHQDTRAELLETRDRYLRCKQMILSGSILENVAIPFLCVTLTGRLQGGDMQIVALTDHSGKAREVISVVLAHGPKVPSSRSSSAVGPLAPESAPLQTSLSADNPSSSSASSPSSPLFRSSPSLATTPVSPTTSPRTSPVPQFKSSSPRESTTISSSSPSSSSAAAVASPRGADKRPQSSQSKSPTSSSTKRKGASRKLPPEASEQVTHWNPHTFELGGKQSSWKVVQCDFCGNTVTPELRPGPRGEGTLCNRCGLQWAKKN